MGELLRIDNLSVSYRDRDRVVRAIDGVSLTLREGSTLALVGESGCGKTTLAMAILNLVVQPGRVESGRIEYDGRDLLQLKGDDVRRVRGNEIAMIFQDPLSGLNPVLSIGTQVEEIVRAHRDVSKRESRRMAVEALTAEGLPQAERIFESYPFQLSGGMCQRVMIAIATILRPRIIIADEPTSALDVTVQASVLHRLGRLKTELGASILLITHDLGVVARMADDVAVMYAGRIVESGAAGAVFARTYHPYTAGLLAALPRHDAVTHQLQPIRGVPPDLAELTGECAFLARCPKAISRCRTEPWPALDALEGSHAVACYNPVYQPEREAAERV
ncbi:MAG: ABC transporter ATP-binding protein [Dehalococcoidia bacterium]